MKSLPKFFLILLLCLGCQKSENNPDNDVVLASPIEGTWQLISGTVIENEDTTVTDYTRDQNMIKIINETHFSFLNHDLKKGQDSSAVFAAGGGRYTLNGDQYTEYLEYCSYREWEGNTFAFTLTIKDDTLTQQGVEKIENLGVERFNIEKYRRIR